ncbi:TusE/DsrC/DsvC family sulfur relay protein [Parasulfuritortus cantonensis]|uniref:TusE/DsrC/DsvC family sulfur relay protein n=1 Tax=Parasulfuritortus cantonensis TaxID=2528202 RepID=A0A4R1BD34_9PROT|nr:TusE/DsrC/DsvC family sulfur relay protein [Parasulfuritortus cantonensis]TCJ14969.1 TusE/DsrC/DsvC family sulfur relay protein [Parasulfuritortus cantonensis]
MNYFAESYVRPGFEPISDPDFPLAPADWSRADAIALARREGLALTEEHWQVVCALQEFYARHDGPSVNVRELHDALDEFFHPEGGIKYLYELFPNGPIAQGCRLAGLQPPPGAADRGFGSVV